MKILKHKNAERITLSTCVYHQLYPTVKNLPFDLHVHMCWYSEAYEVKMILHP